MEAYSMDLRERVVHACDEGAETRLEIAERFGVSTAWIRRLLQRRRETGSFAALPHGGGRTPVFNAKRLERLQREVQKQPDATLAQLRQRLRLSCSVSVVHDALKTLGWTYKKASGRLSKIAPTWPVSAGSGVRN